MGEVEQKVLTSENHYDFAQIFRRYQNCLELQSVFTAKSTPEDNHKSNSLLHRNAKFPTGLSSKASLRLNTWFTLIWCSGGRLGLLLSPCKATCFTVGPWVTM